MSLITLFVQPVQLSIFYTSLSFCIFFALKSKLARQIFVSRLKLRMINIANKLTIGTQPKRQVESLTDNSLRVMDLFVFR